MSLLRLWILFAAAGASIYSLLFFWAVRARQFTDQERARHIALRAEDFLEGGNLDARPSLLDRYAWLGLIAVGLIAPAVAFWLVLK